MPSVPNTADAMEGCLWDVLHACAMMDKIEYIADWMYDSAWQLEVVCRLDWGCIADFLKPNAELVCHVRACACVVPLTAFCVCVCV
jgi:hypothetical protein